MNKKSREMAEIERLLPTVPRDPLPEGDAILLDFARNDSGCREWTLDLLRKGQRPRLERTEVPTAEVDVRMAEMVLENPGCALVSLKKPSRTPTVDLVIDKVIDMAWDAAFDQYIAAHGAPDNSPETDKKVERFIDAHIDGSAYVEIDRLDAALDAPGIKPWATLKEFGIVPENLVSYLLERESSDGN